VEGMSNVFVDVSDQILSLPGTSIEATGVLKSGMERFLELGKKAAQGEDENVSAPESTEMDEETSIDHGVPEGDSLDLGSSDMQTEVDSNPLTAEYQFQNSKGDPSDNVAGFQSHQEHATSPSTSLPTPLAPQSHAPHPPTEMQRQYNETQHIYSSFIVPQSQYQAPSALPDYTFYGSVPQWPQYYHLPPWTQQGPSVLPYILAGRDSFSAHLYFNTIVFAFRVIRGEPDYADAGAYFFRHKLRYGRRARAMTVIGGVIDLMLGGGNRIDTTTAYPHPSIPEDGQQRDISDDEIKALIKTDLESEGEQESDYLSSWEMESYLTDRWRLTLDSTSVRRLPTALGRGSSDPRRFAPTMVTGWGEEDRVRDTRDLVERLKYKAVSIGDGPRWSKKNVDEVVNGFFE
jgi:hypothetical protein